MTVTLANAVSGTGAQTLKNTNAASPVEGVAHADPSSTSTVVIQGRVPPCAGWVDIATLTNGDAKIVAIFPQMRANISANAGTVTVALSVPG